MNIQECLVGRANNFTLLRLLAAIAVLFGHSYTLSTGLAGGEDPISVFFIRIWGESLPSLAVDMFFVTSGFLVCASYIRRKSLLEFSEARFLRIFPGLFVAVTLCVILGAFLTSESLLAYATSPSMHSFLKHNFALVNGVQYDLPGVFTHNPYPVAVNGSLWTLPIEIWMYFWVAILGFLAILEDEKIFNLFFIVSSLLYAQSIDGSFFIAPEIRVAQLSFLFLLGSFFYVNRARTSLSFLYVALLLCLVYFTEEKHFSFYVKGICFAYAVLFLALKFKLKFFDLDKLGDVSYGLYIYAFPVQQALAVLIVGIRPTEMFLLSTTITFILAILSWRYVEKPALALKGRLPFFSEFSEKYIKLKNEN